MSYIKSAFIFDGIGKIVEVHGATWCYLDIQAYGKGLAKNYREWAAEAKKKGSDPSSYERMAADFEKISRNPYSINSGLAHEILDRKLSPITDDNKRDWIRFLLEEDIPRDADNSEEPPAVLASFDENKFYDTEKNFYARYEHSLPEGWSYERITPNRMIDILEKRLPEKDRARLGKLPG